MPGLEAFTGFLGAVKQTGPLIFLAVAVASGIIIFAPPDLATTLGLDDFRSEYRPALGAAFVLSLAIVAVTALHKLGTAMHMGYRTHQRTKVRLQYLEELTPEERGYLVPYILGDVNTQKFLMDDGIARGLESKAILYRASNMFDLLEGAPFNIQPWAKKRLKERPELLQDAVKPKKKRGWV